MPKRSLNNDDENESNDDNYSIIKSSSKRIKQLDREFNRRLNDMKHFIAYNSIIDNKNLKLTNEINTLKLTNFMLMKELSSSLLLQNKDSITKKQNGQSAPQIIELENNGDDYLEAMLDETPDIDYEYKDGEELDKILLRAFSEIKTIEDIIKLDTHPERFSMISNVKFQRLLKIIPSLMKLNNMIGMTKLKEQTFKYIIKFIQRETTTIDLLHTVIYGPPGVGKTDVSKIMGEIYLSLGYLNENKLVIARRSDLVGQYLGETSIKTQNCIDQALGGVLLIDEAYSLGDKEGRDFFSKECINTLNQALTENEKNLICIIVGYEKELNDNFFKHNPGLQRRFTVKYYIDSYDYKELRKILLKQIKDAEYIIDEEMVPEDYLKNHMKYFEYFGGDTKVFVQHLGCCVYRRIFKEKTELSNTVIVTKDDMINTLNEYIDIKKNGKSSKYFIDSIYENN
jgi:hypothetical protein